MASYLRWFLAFLAVLFLSALFQPLMETELARRGWYDNPTDTVGFLVNWISHFVGEANFPWLAAGVFGLAAGAWIDRLLRYVDGRVDPSLVGLSEMMTSFAGQVHGTADFTQKEVFFLLSIAVPIERQLERYGIELNVDVHGGNRGDFLARIAAAYYQIAPMLKSGDVRLARKVANNLNKIIEKKNADIGPQPQ